MLSLSLSLDKNHIIIDGHDQRQTQCRRGWQVPVPKQQCKGVRAAAVERGSRHVQVEIGSLALVEVFVAQREKNSTKQLCSFLSYSINHLTTPHIYLVEPLISSLVREG